jgi:Flp pilus assembly protein TadD
LSRRDYALAEHHLRKAFDLNPNRPAMVADMGYLYSCIGEPEKAIAQFAEARVLDSNFEPTWYWHLFGRALFIARRYSEAIDAFSRSASASAGMQALLAACWAQLENPDEARRHSREAVRLAPEFSIERHMTREPFKHDADRQHLIAALRLAGLPE